jgi:chaperonin GroES
MARQSRRSTPGAASVVFVPDPATVTTDDGTEAEKLPIKMLNDRVLVRIAGPEGERRSSGGILIPATAQTSKRLAWAEVVAVGPNVRAMQPGDHVLFAPEDRYEVEVRGDDYVILRERDVHAVASTRLGEASTGLYL